MKQNSNLTNIKDIITKENIKFLPTFLQFILFFSGVFLLKNIFQGKVIDDMFIGVSVGSILSLPLSYYFFNNRSFRDMSGSKIFTLILVTFPLFLIFSLIVFKILNC